MFENCKTLEELKKAYHEAIKANHPDNGGNDEKAKEINAAYAARFPYVKNIHQNKDGETYEKETEEAPEEFINLINKLLHVPGLVIEILGSFVWISGNTKENKELIKSLGFKWSKNKEAWYLAPKGYHKKSRSDWSLDEIRSTFANRGRFTSNAAGQLLLES